LVVGGTGFYIDALFRGLMTAEIDQEKLKEARRKFDAELAEHGFDEMHKRLRNVDPDLHAQIAREMNPIRLVRAWTHFYATGTPLGEARKQERDRFEFAPEFVILNPERKELWKRIEGRIDEMLRKGWLDEVRELNAFGVDREAPAMRAIGYTELLDVIENKTLLAKAREAIVIRTRQYAKRQVTWLRHQTA
jgi:tRNA dimethylallyltransferase